MMITSGLRFVMATLAAVMLLSHVQQVNAIKGCCCCFEIGGEWEADKPVQLRTMDETVCLDREGLCRGQHPHSTPKAPVDESRAFPISTFTCSASACSKAYEAKLNKENTPKLPSSIKAPVKHTGNYMKPTKSSAAALSPPADATNKLPEIHNKNVRDDLAPSSQQQARPTTASSVRIGAKASLASAAAASAIPSYMAATAASSNKGSVGAALSTPRNRLLLDPMQAPLNVKSGAPPSSSVAFATPASATATSSSSSSPASAAAAAAAAAASASPPAKRVISKVVFVGDLHGDLDTAIAVLKKAGFISTAPGAAKNEFLPPPDTAVAFLGDYFDRGYQDIELFQYLYAARQKFPDHVYMVLGNHEVMVLQNALHYSNVFSRELNLSELQKNQKAFQLRKDLQTCDGKLNQQLRSLPLMLVVGGVLIAHAGPSLEWARYLKVKGPLSPHAYFNEQAGKELEQACTMAEFAFTRAAVTHPLQSPHLAGGGVVQTCGAEPPIWFRGLSQDKDLRGDATYGDACCQQTNCNPPRKSIAALSIPETVCQEIAGECYTGTYDKQKDQFKTLTVCQAVKEILQTFGAERMVVAHQIQYPGIRSLCDGAIFFVDVGLSNPGFRDVRKPDEPEYAPQQFLYFAHGALPQRVYVKDSKVEPVPGAGATKAFVAGVSCEIVNAKAGLNLDMCTPQ